MFTIKPRTRIQEGASWEDIQNGDCYEIGYEIYDMEKSFTILQAKKPRAVMKI